MILRPIRTAALAAVFPLLLSVALAFSSASAQGTPACTFVVVHCNYAALYDGSVEWEVKLESRNSRRIETVTVTITKGVATCRGSVTVTEQGVTTSGTIGGGGIVAVEFDRTGDIPVGGGKYYLVTAACPSVAGMGSPVTPPTLDGREYHSDKQPSTLIPGSALKGTTTSSPDDDPVNGVKSLVRVTWDLTKAKSP
jgi:hypothetical protein